MARFLLTRRLPSLFSAYPSVISKSFRAFRLTGNTKEENSSPDSDNFSKPKNLFRGLDLPSLIPSKKDQLEDFNIELVDPDIWQVSFGLGHISCKMDGESRVSASSMENEVADEICDNDESVGEVFPDFDEIEDLRLRKKLFYKLDKGSKEFEECDINFHRKKSLKKSHKKPRKADLKKECKKTEKMNPKSLAGGDRIVKQKGKASAPQERAKSFTERDGIGLKALALEEKKKRTPTFNQLTDPYHLPFCLDIYITKGSVRASIIHRITSKVVTVAHSISKDMKFDLTSRKDAKACAAVGGVLAQRAIEDDIHNVVYTPRKGDKIEGKLQIVLQSVIDNGLDVKVKLKQKKLKGKQMPLSCSGMAEN